MCASVGTIKSALILLMHSGNMKNKHTSSDSQQKFLLSQGSVLENEIRLHSATNLNDSLNGCNEGNQVLPRFRITLNRRSTLSQTLAALAHAWYINVKILVNFDRKSLYFNTYYL